MKTKIFMLWMGLVLFTTTVNAQWAVFDPSNLAQGIVNTTRQVVQFAVYATEVSMCEYLTYTTEETEKLEVMRLAEKLDGGIELAIKQLAESKRE